MERTNITSELLERYHLGRCTDAEISCVEHWLAGDDEELPSEIDTAQQEKTGNELWAKLEADTILQKKNRYISIYIYRFTAIAAGLLLTVLALGYLQSDLLTGQITQSSPKKIIQKRFNDLLLTALPDEVVNFNYNIPNKTGEIQFSRAMLIKNNGTEDVNLQIQTISSDGNVLREFLCKKGVSYVVIRLDKEDEAGTGQKMLLLEQDKLWTIPPVQAISDFYKQLNELERMNRS